MNNDRSPQYYSESVGYFKHDLSLLFQRFNFFLVATSFLIVAFVTLFSARRFWDQGYDGLRWLSHILAFSGVIVSYVFAVVNFLNCRLIWDIGKYVRDLENHVARPSPFNQLYGFIAPRHKFDFAILYKVYEQALYFIARPGPDEQYQVIAPHTWLMPIFFFWVWIVSWVFVFIRNPERLMFSTVVVLAHLVLLVTMKLPDIRHFCKLTTGGRIWTALLLILFFGTLAAVLFSFGIIHLP